ncbi:MAG TPA: hypothetical protein VGP72_11720 [Planctomycetota bacterium]
MAVLVLLISLGLFLLPWLDRVFAELAPVESTTKPALMQLRLTDLLLTSVSYGIVLAIASLFAPRTGGHFVWIAGYLLIAELIGLLAAMDVARRTRYRNDVLQRSCIFLIFFIIFPLVLPAALAAWSRWSRRCEKG